VRGTTFSSIQRACARYTSSSRISLGDERGRGGSAIARGGDERGAATIGAASAGGASTAARDAGGRGPVTVGAAGDGDVSTIGADPAAFGNGNVNAAGASGTATTGAACAWGSAATRGVVAGGAGAGMAATTCGDEGAAATPGVELPRAAAASLGAIAALAVRAISPTDAATAGLPAEGVLDAICVGGTFGGIRDATKVVSPVRFFVATCGERVVTVRATVASRGTLALPASCARRAASAFRAGDACATADGGGSGAFAPREGVDAGLER